jgi:hypothetical protein
MEGIIKNEYFQLPSAPTCTFDTIHKNSKDYVESVNFSVSLNGGDLINISINVLNKDLVFTINKMHLKGINSEALIDLSNRLKAIEGILKPELKPYFGL